MKKKFLIVNENGSDNIGDHAINEGLKSLVTMVGGVHTSCYFSAPNKLPLVGQRKIQKQNFRVVFKKKLTKFQFIRALASVRWYFKNKPFVEKALENKSYVLIGGGQLVLSGGFFPIAMYLWIKSAVKKGVVVNVVGVGCGENFTFFEKYLYRKSMVLADSVFVREKESIEKLRRFFKVDAEFLPDLAFGLKPFNTFEKEDKLVVGVTDYSVFKKYIKETNYSSVNSSSSYIDTWIELIKESINNENTTILFASTTLQDAEINRLVYHRLKNELENNTILIDSVLPLDEYRLILSRSNAILSGRMHSLILGHVEGCRLIPFYISSKIKLFIKNYYDVTPKRLNDKLVKKFLSWND